jgi:RNA polymerase sigma factor (sigma-70 family)
VSTTVEAGSVAAPGSFEGVYRGNVAAVTAFFARRCAEPQTVADLTSETFLEAVESFRTFDADRGSPRAWLFGIARHVYARHCAAAANSRQAGIRLAAQLTLDDDEIQRLAAKIDDQRAGRRLLERCARLPEIDRAAIELVDLSGLSVIEAAATLDVSPGALRVRLFRARARLRKGAERP